MDQTAFKGYRIPAGFDSTPIAVFFLAIVYAAIALGSFATTTVPGHIAPIFPPAGVALAVALILGRRCLPGVFLGSCAANAVCYVRSWTPLSPYGVAVEVATILVVGLGAVAGAGAGAALVRRLCQNRHPLDSGRDVLVLITVGAIGCCTISATMGVLSLSLAGLVPWNLSPYLWLTWWLGDSTGAILAAPLVLAWLDRRPFETRPRQGWEAAALTAALLLLSFLVCFRSLPLEYGLVPLLLWAGYRFGMRGASAAAAVVGFLATIGTVHGSSAFVGPTVNDSLLRLYSFISVFLISSLLLAGVLAERERADKALRASEEWYRQIARCIPDLLWTMDLSGRFTYANPALQRTHGWTLAEFLTLTFRDMEPPEEAAKHAAIIEEELTKAADPHYDRNTMHILETRQLRRDGTPFEAEVSATLLWSDEAEPVGVIGVTRDITERKRAEEHLQEARQRLEGLVQSAMDAIISVDDQQLIVLFNKAAETMFRCPAEKAIGGSLDPFIPERFREAHREHIRRYGQIGQTARTMGQLQPLTGLRADGEEFPIEASISQVETGGRRLYSVILRDITERQQAEDALRESEQRFRSMADAIPQLAWIAHPDGFIYWYNRRWYEYTGTLPEQMEGWGWQSVHNPETLPAVLEKWKVSIATGEPFDMVFPLRGADGVFRLFLTRVQPLKDGQGRVVQWFGTNTDVDELKRAEEALRELNETLERRVTERTAVAEDRAAQLRMLALQLAQAEQKERQRVSDVLHEHFQQLLVGVKYSLSMVEPYVAGGGGKEPLRQANQVLNEAVQASRSLAVELSPPILHHGGLREALRWLAEWMRDKYHLQVHVQADPSVDPIPEDLRALFFQAARELLFNVVKHAGVGQATVEVSRQDEEVQLCVRDEGAGFDPAGPPAEDAAVPSLGLLTLRERIGFLGGRVDIKSAPGAGTTVQLWLPLPNLR